ncbi:hypothetical protein H7R52_13605 [Weissella confusa]|uniref:Phosphoribosylglycinamide formyltransferase n=1 Tax=Weissella confusa TaxID=1583 RepID=A0A923SNQ9_WEICO|nr:hypothetical protein [Weissella confusa]
MVKKPKLAVFASGTGSNLAALLKAAQADTLGGDIVRVVIDRKSAGAIAISGKLTLGLMANVTDFHGNSDAWEFDAS